MVKGIGVIVTETMPFSHRPSKLNCLAEAVQSTSCDFISRALHRILSCPAAQSQPFYSTAVTSRFAALSLSLPGT